MASSYLLFFIDPNRVFVFEIVEPLDMLVLAALCSSWAISRLFLLRAPFWRVMWHWAIWKKYWSGSYGPNSTLKFNDWYGSILALSGRILNGFLTHYWVVLFKTLRRLQSTSIANGNLFLQASYLDSENLPVYPKEKSMKSVPNMIWLVSLVTSENISLCKTT